jgi:hypothetical protein
VVRLGGRYREGRGVPPNGTTKHHSCINVTKLGLPVLRFQIKCIGIGGGTQPATAFLSFKAVHNPRGIRLGRRHRLKTVQTLVCLIAGLETEGPRFETPFTFAQRWCIRIRCRLIL